MVCWFNLITQPDKSSLVDETPQKPDKQAFSAEKKHLKPAISGLLVLTGLPARQTLSQNHSKTSKLVWPC